MKRLPDLKRQVAIAMTEVSAWNHGTVAAFIIDRLHKAGISDITIRSAFCGRDALLPCDCPTCKPKAKAT